MQRLSLKSVMKIQNAKFLMLLWGGVSWVKLSFLFSSWAGRVGWEAVPVQLREREPKLGWIKNCMPIVNSINPTMILICLYLT